MDKGTCVYIKHGDIILDIGYYYHIDLKRCSTPEQVLKWVHHLSTKTAVTGPMIRRFIELTTKKIGIKIYDIEI